MSQTTLDWDVIQEAARMLGVRKKNLEKWKQRKAVPAKWQLRLIKDAGLSLDDFEPNGCAK